MRTFVVGCLLVGACGADPAPGDRELVAATIDGTSWRAHGQAVSHVSVNPTTGGSTQFFGIHGYTPRPPTADGSRTSTPTPGTPRLEILFTGGEPSPGTYDVATTPNMTVTYGPDETRTFAAQTGSVVITRIDPRGVDGSFAFVGTLTPSGADAVTVSEGSFSAPIGIVPCR